MEVMDIPQAPGALTETASPRLLKQLEPFGLVPSD